jgi:hypothetical protein
MVALDLATAHQHAHGAYFVIASCSGIGARIHLSSTIS